MPSRSNRFDHAPGHTYLRYLAEPARPSLFKCLKARGPIRMTPVDMFNLHAAYRSALFGVGAVWFIVASLAVGGVTAWQGWDVEQPIPGGRVGLILSIASLVIAVTSLFPGLIASSGASADPIHPETIGNRFMIGMTIRLPGTVALFFASSYYITASALWIAIWVLLWHAILLATEVTILLRPLPKC